MTVSVGGDLSSDAASPGLLHEGFKVLNRTVTRKNPTMLFDIRRNAQGEIDLMHFYACLPNFGPQVFSYLLYSRTPWIQEAEIRQLVAEDNNTGVFDMTGCVVTAPDAWRRCGILPRVNDLLLV
eukprot:CAMPEP_0197675762 /NCGR_PEP_ID=MMETSP1338-20131121/85553_1 /TAXON_ID=43686 ORGANISM="Pelagodinium beii, Strain RCC1491" /NCGR_SAMPLE_ID=MMETSP1338 /ASSEMBLY_ACC=CAM_ASM_000754 /LENGTH=123 /DNA_ID=CAMNT_0043256353 /DNA_START=40 /DNA_END=411 /DNA_ORIENTATION=-